MADQVMRGVLPAVNTLITIAIIVVVTTLIAWLVAVKFGGRSKVKRRAVFTVVGGVGLVLALVFAYLRASGKV